MTGASTTVSSGIQEQRCLRQLVAAKASTAHKGARGNGPTPLPHRVASSKAFMPVHRACQCHGTWVPTSQGFGATVFGILQKAAAYLRFVPITRGLTTTRPSFKATCAPQNGRCASSNESGLQRCFVCCTGSASMSTVEWQSSHLKKVDRLSRPEGC